jgi:ATP-dependent helicase/nuclease subunit A
MTASGRLTKEEYQVIRIRDLTAFLCSDLGKRMIEADREGRLYREQPFVLGVPASEIRGEWPDDEMVFVQGIIDAYFYEDDEIVLVDYKTDYVREAEELLEKYRVQVDQYAKALSRVAGRKIKEKLIWSFRLNRPVAG